jgi:hypothetical protein
VKFNSNSSFAPDDPDAWYYFEYGNPTLYKYSVSTGNATVVKTFPAGLGPLGGSTDWIDRSGRYMVLVVGDSTRVYDRVSDTLYAGGIPSTYGAGGGWSSISPDGNYVITSTPPRYSHSWKIDHATKSVSTTPVLFWTLCGGHADVVSASNGKTYFVSFDCRSTAAVYAVDVTLPQTEANTPQQLSQNRKLFQTAWADSGHFSRVSRGGWQDWMFVSVESGDDECTDTTASWRPFKQEIVMANVLTGEVRRLAHHRSRGLNGSNYYAQPRVSSTWDGSVVLWTSNFGDDSTDGYADLYAVDVAGGSTAPAPSPTPTPSPAPLALSFANPASGATVSGTVTVSVTATGGSGSGYTYSLLAGSTALYTGSNNGFSWNTTSSANGSVTLTATVTDSAGTKATTTRTVTVSNTSSGSTGGTTATAPTVSITSPSSGVWTGNSILIAMQAASTAGVARIELWGGGKVMTTVSCSGTTCTGSYRWPSASAAKGAYLLNAVAYDTVGGRATSAAITIYKSATSPTYASGAPTGTVVGSTGGTTTTATTTVAATTTADTTNPTAAITSPPSGTWTGNSLLVYMKATDNVAVKTVALYADGVLAVTTSGTPAVLSCSGSTCEGELRWSSGSLPSGKHLLTAIATDTSGNTTTSAAVTINK